MRSSSPPSREKHQAASLFRNPHACHSCKLCAQESFLYNTSQGLIPPSSSSFLLPVIFLALSASIYCLPLPFHPGKTPSSTHLSSDLLCSLGSQVFAPTFLRSFYYNTGLLLLLSMRLCLVHPLAIMSHLLISTNTS